MIAIALWAMAATLCGTPACADRTEAARLVVEARELIALDKYAEARDKLAEAVAAAPEYPEIYANLGYLDELTAAKERALANYGRTLELRSGHKHARNRFRHLFFEGHFPRWISLRFVKYGPVSLVTETCQARFADLTGLSRLHQRRFAYTTSLLFPEEMDRGDPALQIRIPAAGEDPGLSTVVNRATYGLTMEPDTDVLRLRFVVQYPSATISRNGNDYSELAPLLTHVLLRFSLHSEIYLGRAPQGDSEGLVHVYFCEAGPVGAEQYQDNIYLYDVVQGRSPLEWAREMAHELGHYLLPPVGRFEEPEPWGNGELGERLFLQWLAAEAGEVTGERWPAETAQSALANLWQGQQMDLDHYIQHECRPLLDFWLEKSPDSPLIAGAKQPSLDYFIGFCLWAQAAHGPAVLAEMLDSAAGTSIADFALAYKATVEQVLARGALSVSAEALNLAGSQLSLPPTEGALGREEVKLGPEDVVVLPVFLPAGAWQLTAQSQPQDAQLHLTTELGEDTMEGVGTLSIAVGQGGWHQIRVTAPQVSEVIELQGFTVAALPQV